MRIIPLKNNKENGMKIKFGKKQIILVCVVVVLVGILIAANIVLDLFSPILHRVFGGDLQVAQTEEAANALAAGNELVQELTEESIVLLTNKKYSNGKTALPLDMNTPVNLFGWNATDQGFMLSGGGSGGTAPSDANKVTLAQALEREGMEYNEELLAAYSAVSNADADSGSAQANWLYNPDAGWYTTSRMDSAYAFSDVAIIVLSRFGRENGGDGELVNAGGSSYNAGAILELTANEKAMFNAVKNTFGEDGKIIVLLNTCNNMELSFLEEYDVDAALYVGIPGQSGALAIPRVLRGRAKDLVKHEDGSETIRYVTPSGRTADIYPYSYNPENGKNYNSIWVNAISGATSDKNSVVYSEGIYYGYKWYETAGEVGFFDAATRGEKAGYEAVVQFPFGYGLSYTDFKWTVKETPTASLTKEGEYKVVINVENIGEVPGREVVQLYYTPQYYNGGVEKAHMNLLAFDKTVELASGASQDITLTFTTYDLASYDDYGKSDNGFTGYEVEHGTYTFRLMKNSHYEHECYNGPEKTASTFTLECAEDIKFDKDPVTGATVENRFTGNNAYGNTPIDGSTANSNAPITYLSRKDNFANFSSIQKYTASAAGNTTNEVYGDKDISKIKFGEDAKMYLVTDENGNKLSIGILDGSVTNNEIKLTYNVDLMLELADWDNEELWTAFLNQMSWNDTLDLIGKGGFQTDAIEALGKPRATDLDGPAGFNSSSVTDPSKTSQWTAFPSEALLGCSWSQRLMYNMGRAQGVIANATGINGWYGPGVNLHRSPYNSRNFEYYSEDGLLSGKLAAEVIRGAKQTNLYCYLKHFAASEAGQNPNNWYTWLTEQNLRENYLRPFEIAVKEGGANAIMSAFNRVGKDWAGRNAALSVDILRNEWGFKGTMITDWYDAGYMEYRAGVLGGNDLWLGGTSQQRASGLSQSNTSDVYAARRSAKNILYTYIDTYVTTYEYINNPDVDDKYKVEISNVNINAAPFSGVFVFLWVLIDVLIVGGIAVCVVFFILSQRDKSGKAAPAAASASDAPTEE